MCVSGGVQDVSDVPRDAVNLRRLVASTGIAALLSVPAMGQALQSPVGIWEIEMRDSRYRVEMCGADGSQLCGTLIWLGNGADSPENLPYLNTLMIDHAPQTGLNQWRGRCISTGRPRLEPSRRSATTRSRSRAVRSW